MTGKSKLIIIKTAHTLIWTVFVFLIFYVLYSGLTGKIGFLTWFGIAAVIAEGLILAIFRLYCPLTIIARKYSNSERDNFDIYLPNWLARHNKLIFTSIFVLGLVLVLYRTIFN